MASSEENQNDKEQLNAAERSLSKQDPSPTLVSWGIRGISLLIILSFIGYFIWSSLQPMHPPKFEFKVQSAKIEQRNNRWVIPVVVTNKGDLSVKALTFNGVHTHPQYLEGTQEKKADVGLLGPLEEVTIELWYDLQPTEQTLAFDVTSYVLP